MAELSDFTSDFVGIANEHEPKKARMKTKVDFPLPGSSSNFENHHKNILLAYLMESRRGEKELIYTDFSENSLGFSTITLSKNNKFLESIGLLEKGSKHGYYRLTSDGIKLADYIKYDKDEDGRRLLGNLLRNSWIYESAKKLLILKRNSVLIEDMIKELAHASKADLSKHKNQLRVLIDYLEYAGAIEIDLDNKISLVSQFEASDSNDPKEVSEPDMSQRIVENENDLEDKNKETGGSLIKVLETRSESRNNITGTEKASLGGVAINVDLSIKIEITPEMTPEDVQEKLNAIISSLKNMD